MRPVRCCLATFLAACPSCPNHFSANLVAGYATRQLLLPHSRASTSLYAGRERRGAAGASSSDKEPDRAERKLIADEEESRKKRIGQMKHRLQRSASREDRISILERKLRRTAGMSECESNEYMPGAERAELRGLLEAREAFEEQYDPLTFTEEHLEFKAMHNDAFIQLARYCEREKDDGGARATPREKDAINVFFLDGPDGGTASALINRGGFQAGRCFVANRHESSCELLRLSGGGLLPDQNVVHATASEALTAAEPLSPEGAEGTSAGEDDTDVTPLHGEDGAFAHVDFAAYYFDGCGGFVPHVVGMLSAALLRRNRDSSSGPIAVGYSLLGGNKDVVGKELTVSQALTVIARRRGMRVVHALDDPARYGLPLDIKKVGGSGGSGTFTTWLLLQPDNSI